MKKNILEAINTGRLWFDGGTGSMLQSLGLPPGEAPESFNLARPDLVEKVHRAYIEAGADIIETNTFSSNRISQREYGLESRAAELAREGACIARREADRAISEGHQVWVAGSVGPTAKSLTLGTGLTD